MTRMTMRLVAAAGVLVLAGCASKPPKQELYGALAAATQVATPAQAALTEPLVAVPGTPLAFELTSGNGIVSYASYRSYYRPIRVQADAGGKVSFTLTSLCTCFGFDKRIVIPVVAAFDAAGAPLAIDNPQYQPVKGGGFKIAFSGTVRTAAAGEVRLLAMSDNAMPDVVVSTTRMTNQYGQRVMDVYVKSNPVGELALKVD